jgi:hypothetical protein
MDLNFALGIDFAKWVRNIRLGIKAQRIAG